MGTRRVEASAVTSRDPETLWRALRDFCAPWHPLVTRMWAERDHGRLVRAFTVDGEDTVYRERLTWFSDSRRELAYAHVEGIAGVRRYTGQLSVVADGAGSRVIMAADIEADEPRLDQIATGTQAIFDIGVKAAVEVPDAAMPATDIGSCDLRDVEIDGDPRLSLRVAGEGETLCLFLHGIGGWRGNWDDQLREVSPMAKAAALDLRGYGRSELGASPTTVDDYCNDILRVRNALGARRLVLCGLSYGAWIATSFAMRHGDALAGLVLSGGCTGMSEAGPEERAAFREAREVPLNAGQTTADFAPAVVDVITGPQATEEMRDHLLKSMEAIPAETYRDALRCFTNPPEKFDFSMIKVPVLMMTGEHDRLAPPDEIEGVARRIWAQADAPDVRFETLQDAGHVCNLEAPERYNAALTEFLSHRVG